MCLCFDGVTVIFSPLIALMRGAEDPGLYPGRRGCFLTTFLIAAQQVKKLVNILVISWGG